MNVSTLFELIFASSSLLRQNMPFIGFPALNLSRCFDRKSLSCGAFCFDFWHYKFRIQVTRFKSELGFLAPRFREINEKPAQKFGRPQLCCLKPAERYSDADYMTVKQAPNFSD
jgi:hypothetical protein